MTDSEFTGRIFHAPDARCEWMAREVAKSVDCGAALRILDLGCGAGALVFRLAELLPNASLTGIDLSAPNIEAARAALGSHPAAKRISFVHGDYLEASFEPFDVVTSDSSLQNIPASREALFGKLSRDVAAGGALIANIPHDCVHNRLLWGVRAVCRAMRSRPLEELIFRAGRALHGREYSDDMIRERVMYMFVRTYNRDCAGLRRFLRESCGFDIVREAATPHASPAQPKHKLIVFKHSCSG